MTLKQVMSSPAGPIVDEDTFDADKLTDADTIVSKKAFAGPYTLTAFKINESAAYAKNDSYKGLTRPRTPPCRSSTSPTPPT